MEKNKTPQNDKDVKVLRTYTSDMAEAIRENEVSVIKIAMAEKEKQDREQEYKKTKETNFSKILLLFGGVVLIVVAIFGAIYLINKKKVVPIPPSAMAETFISYDLKSDIDITKATNVNNLTNIIKKGGQLIPKTIEALFLFKKINNASITVTSNDFLSLLKTNMPTPLIRSLSNKFLLGKYSNPGITDSKKTALFLVFETNDYNLAYASMLEWEGTMLEDLFVLFDITKPDENSPFVKPWNDIIVSNKDVRVLYDNNGVALLYYAFVNKNNFVITDNLNALHEVIARLIIKNAD